MRENFVVAIIAKATNKEEYEIDVILFVWHCDSDCHDECRILGYGDECVVYSYILFGAILAGKNSSCNKIV